MGFHWNHETFAARHLVEAAIEDLISLLDTIDADDEDREDSGDDELSLGAPERHPSTYCGWAPAIDASLRTNQVAWADGSNDPLRDESENAADERHGRRRPSRTRR